MTDSAATPTDQLRFSVVVCTHNRATYLERALAGLGQLNFAPGDFETLVVDNASTDSTRQCVLAFEGVRYVYEPKLGLSVARNTGWREAKGRFVAYLDDDAIPHRDWLRHASQVFDEFEGEIGMLGGRVEPVWETPRPTWLDDDLLAYLSMVDLGPHPRFIDEEVGIVGANMIIPRDILERTGGFSEAVGRRGKLLLSNEEILFKRELTAAGYRGYYKPEVSVSHHAIAERVTRRWFLRRFYWQGRSDAALKLLQLDLPYWRRVGRAGDEIRRAIVEYAKSPPAKSRFSKQALFTYRLGMAVGLL